MLRDRLAANPDVTFRYGATVAEVTQNADGVDVRLEDGEVVRGAWLDRRRWCAKRGAEARWAWRSRG